LAPFVAKNNPVWAVASYQLFRPHSKLVPEFREKGRLSTTYCLNIATLVNSSARLTERQKTMARPGDNYRLRWRSKKANKGRKPSKGRVKGWSTKHYPHLYA
jgi:hypothetical protein